MKNKMIHFKNQWVDKESGDTIYQYAVLVQTYNKDVKAKKEYEYITLYSKKDYGNEGDLIPVMWDSIKKKFVIAEA